MTFEKAFTITVTNVNEAPTDISASSTSVAENQSTGTVVGNLSTTDVDAGNTFTYSLVSGTGDTDNASFQIVNGQLQTNASFDFETKSSYSIRVRSTDQGSLTFEKAFTITVTNVNEGPTDISVSSTSVAENQSTGTAVGNLSTTDVDAGNTFTYSLVSGTGDTDNASFQIVNGELQTNASFDFETKSSYSIRVRSTDQGSLTFEKAFTITVTNVNEAPVNTVPSSQTVNEDTNLVFSVATSNAITVADIDATIVQVTLSVNNGTLTLSSLTGLSFITGDGTADAMMVFSGSKANINTALDGLTYRGSLNFYGFDTLNIITSDLGATGVGGAMADQDTVAITVVTVNDAPALDLDLSTTNRTQIFSGTPVSFTSTGTSLTDVDSSTFDNLKISFATNLFVDGANEKLYVGNSTGEIASNLGGITNRNGSFALNSTTFDFSVVVTSGMATISITGASGSVLTLLQAEAILDALRYDNVSNIRTSIPARVFSVVATDGGALASNTETLTIQITPSVPSILQGSDDTGRYNNDRLTADNTLNFTGIGGIGDTIYLVIGSTTVGTGVVGANGTFSVTTSVLPNGVHNIYAIASNSLGLSSQNSSSVTWEIRNLQISQPVIGNNNGLPQVTGTGTIGTLIFVTIGTGTYSVPVDNTGNWTVNLSTAVPLVGIAPAIVVGSYPISVVSQDLAGNASTPVTSALTVTSPVQPAPVITSNPSTSDNTPVVSGVCEAGSLITLTLQDSNNNLIATYGNISTAVNGTWLIDLQTAVPQGGTIPIPALLNGNSYNLSATATDANSQFTSVAATQKLIIDNTVPNIPVITSPAIVNDSTPLFTGTAEPGTVIELTIKRANGTAITIYQTATNPTAPTWSIDFSQISPSAGFLNDLADGNYILEVVSIDAAFNRSAAATQNPFVVDTIAPATPVVTSPSLTNDNTPVLAGTAEPNSTVTVVINGFTYTTAALSPSGAWSVNLQTSSTALTDGIHLVTVTATDLAGNTSAPATQNLRIDTTPPVIPQITSSNKNNDTTPVITGLAEPSNTVAVIINGSTFSTIVGPNGSWSVDLGTAIPNGGTTSIAPLVTANSYPISVTATDPAGNTSALATQTLAIDTSAPISPMITSPAITNQVPPTVTGTAQPGPGSTVTLTINGATFTTLVDSNGNWTVNTATATATSGSFSSSFPDGPYPISVYSINGFNNQSGTSIQTLTVDRTPPVIVGALASFGGNLNFHESNSNAIVSVNINGIEDGRSVIVTLNGLTYTGTVYSGKVDITIPAAILSNLADGSSQTLTVTASDLAGNAATPYQVPFTVDKTGPARPAFTGISSSNTDPTPDDRFTSVVNPTVVMRGQAGQTIVVIGPNGVVNPSDYTITETNGLYTISFSVNQLAGDYMVNLRDANGNESANGNDAQNFFRIDSIPILFDNPQRRSASIGSTYGNMSIKNVLNGQVFDVPQQTDSTWIDLDGQALTFGLAGSSVIETDQSNNPTMLETSSNGATLRINVITGAYIYTPVPMTDRTDSFLLMVRDSNGNQTQLQLSFNSLDTLDRDGVVGSSESMLAGIITGAGDSSNLAGDLNRDGISDSNQNSVTTFAWRKEADFLGAMNSATVQSTEPSSIVCMVVNESKFDPNTTTTLAQLMGNVNPLAQLLQIQVTNTNGLLPDSTTFSKPWDLINFSVESLVSTGLNDINPDRPGTQIQVAIDISNANIPAGTFGFSMYRKHLTANTIADYSDAGITLNDLSGNIITTPGWYDYTQRTPGGDGAIFKDFNNDGKLDAIILTFTDNAFGDDNPSANKLTDPGTPVGSSSTTPGGSNPGGSNPAVPTPPGSNPPVPSITGFAATGRTLAAISGTNINIFPAGSTIATTSFVPFPEFQGEVRLTRADINNDGTPDIIASMGAGGLPLIRAFDGSNPSNKLLEFMAYDQAFTGGVFVAIGDLGNDGILDIVTGAGNSGGPHVKIFNSITGAETSSFMAYDSNFRGGVSVAVGDIDGSGFAAIVTGAGQGGGPHVKVFNGTDHSLIKQFMAYASTFSGGVYVAVGDYLSDGKYEIITGAGAGGGPHIKIWDYETLNLDGQTMAFTDFTKPNGEVIDAIFTGGVRVALADANGDNVLDILAGAGPNGGPRVEVFVGFRLELLMDFFTGDKNDETGVFVSK